jgi:hypothetical protein
MRAIGFGGIDLGRWRYGSGWRCISIVAAGLLSAFVLLAGSAAGALPVKRHAHGSTVRSASGQNTAMVGRSSPRLRQVDGGPGYYRRFANSLPTKPSYFPIGVWFESVTSQRDINLDKDVGLNTYVVLTANSKLALVRRNGMKALLQHEEWAPARAAGSQTAGWVLHDEIDMQRSPEAGYAELQRIKRSLPADRLLRYNNFGKGVVLWENNFEAGRYVNAVDLPSTDIYWFADNNVCGRHEGGRLLAAGRRRLTEAECHRAANYGSQVQRVRRLVSPRGSKPVWTFVELGHPFSEDHWPSITPPQIRAAVWHGLIAGARGITYFNHSFGGPCRTQHALRDPCYVSVRATVKATNKQIRSLAHVLNAPFVTSHWTHSRTTKAMMKWASGHFYLFAGSAENASSTSSFSIRCVGNATAKVLGENRTIPIRSGSFRDSFADGNAVHVYRIDGGKPCGLKRRS